MQAIAGPSVAIIGGGVSGITTAVLLRLLGYQTALYSRVLPSHEPGAARPAEFATLHAAASVLPHSVASPKVADWTCISQAFFRALSFRGCCGVRRQVHYEIFEDPISGPPVYADSVENFSLLQSDDLCKPWVPRQSGAEQTYGWQFDAFFCEAPDYIRFLFEFYAAIGGRMLAVPGSGGLVDYLECNHDVYVNCAGMASPALLAAVDPRLMDAPAAPDFEPLADRLPVKLIRGHYLRLDVKQIVTGHRGQFFSYSYRPSASIYQTATATPADIYCYPRSDAWILGGSRQEGMIDEAGNWVGERTIGAEIEFAGADATSLAIPAPILTLHADILLRLTKGRLDLLHMVQNDPAMVSPGIGYRFVRDSPSDSVRLGCSRIRFSGMEKHVLHNYGHGGAGYTLSWECAFDIVRLLRRITAQPRIPAEGRGQFAIGHEATRLLLLGVLAGLEF